MALAVGWQRKMRSSLVAVSLCVLLSGCAVMDSVLDAPMSLFVEDEETGEMVEVQSTVGDAIADNADGVAGIVSNTLGGVSPLAALLSGGAAAALLGKARRKKKAVVVPEAAATEDQGAVG